MNFLGPAPVRLREARDLRYRLATGGGTELGSLDHDSLLRSERVTLHPAVVELDDVVGHPRHARIVGRDHEGDTVLGEAPDDGEEILRRPAVKLRRRLVRNDDRRTGRQHLRERGALLLASRQLPRQMVSPVCDPKRVEELVGCWAVRSLRCPRGQAQVLVDCQVVDEVVRRALEDEPYGRASHRAQAPGRHGRQVEPVHEHLPARRQIEPCEEAEERGLAASRRADDGRHCAPAKRDIDPAQGLDLLGCGRVRLHERVAGGGRAFSRQGASPLRNSPARPLG